MIKGSCLCGRVSYEFSGEPLKSVVCHCLECRKVSGSAFSINVMIPKAALKVTGKVKNYDFVQEVGDTFTTAFCETCGSTVYKSTDRVQFKDIVVVEGGTLNEGFQELTKPSAEFFTKHRAHWLDAVAGVEQVVNEPSRTAANVN